MARKPDVYHEFIVKNVKFESAKAYLFELEGATEAIWVPKSQCDYDADSGAVNISEWIIGQKPELSDLLKAGRASS
jgi:hypothetical protein